MSSARQKQQGSSGEPGSPGSRAPSQQPATSAAGSSSPPKYSQANYLARVGIDGPINVHGAPSPENIDTPMHLTSATDCKVAFEMLDEKREGMLDRSQSRSWLRCMGWCVPDEDLDEMLSSISAPHATSGHLHHHHHVERTKWSLKQLIEVNDTNRDKRTNSSVETLHSALRRLANSRNKISRDRLLDFTLSTEGSLLSEDDFNQVLGSIGLSSAKQLDVEQLTVKLLDRICDPPAVAEMNDFMP